MQTVCFSDGEDVQKALEKLAKVHTTNIKRRCSSKCIGRRTRRTIDAAENKKIWGIKVDQLREEYDKRKAQEMVNHINEQKVSHLQIFLCGGAQVYGPSCLSLMQDEHTAKLVEEQDRNKATPNE